MSRLRGRRADPIKCRAAKAAPAATRARVRARRVQALSSPVARRHRRAQRTGRPSRHDASACGDRRGCSSGLWQDDSAGAMGGTPATAGVAVGRRSRQRPDRAADPLGDGGGSCRTDRPGRAVVGGFGRRGHGQRRTPGRVDQGDECTRCHRARSCRGADEPHLPRSRRRVGAATPARFAVGDRIAAGGTGAGFGPADPRWHRRDRDRRPRHDRGGGTVAARRRRSRARRAHRGRADRLDRGMAGGSVPCGIGDQRGIAGGERLEVHRRRSVRR